MSKYLPPVIAASLTAIMLATFAVAQPGLAINKDTSLQGTGSAGSALGVNFTNVQKRIGNSCPSGQAIRAIDTFSNVTCESTGGFSTSNVIPKGNGTGLGASTITEASGVVTAAKSSSVAVLDVGDDTSLTTNAQNGYRVTAFSDGNNYIDSKAASSGSTIYRCGHGTETGANKSWLTVTNSSGNVTFGFNTSVNGNTTIGDANTDTLTITAKVNSNVYYTGTAPTLSSCGTGATVVGNNERGRVTIGTGGSTGCVITFAGGGFTTNAPACSIQQEFSDNNITYVASTSTTAITVVHAGTNFVATNTFSYHCDGIL